MHSFAAPLGLWMATIHVVLAENKECDHFFKYETREEHPFITWLSTIFSNTFFTVNILLSILETEKRVRLHFFKNKVQQM